MLPIFFGESAHQLYGVYHPPTGRAQRERAILICAPIGQEYMRAHRALKVLAQSLAKRGWHVLRFDYSGCGDSAGDFEDIKLQDLTASIRSAALELMAMTRLSKIDLLGLRLGATLASLASQGLATEQLLLWDPICQGSRYLTELEQGDAKLERLHDPYFRQQSPLQASELPGSEFMGYFYSSSFLSELAQLDLLKIAVPVADSVYLFTSHQETAWDQLASYYSSSGLSVTCKQIDSPSEWCEVDNFGSVLLPATMIQGIAAEF